MILGNRIGEEKLNKFGSKMKIVDYRNAKDIDVYFEEYNWVAKNKQYYNFKIGNIKCPYEPKVYNSGYLGEGKYKCKENGKTTRIYNTWNSMIERCCSQKFKNKNHTYSICKVCDEWLNFQVFAEWFHENYYEINGEIIDLDKDFLSGKTKIYSPQTCVFIPQSINKTIIHTRNKHSGLPTGVIHANDNANVYVVKYRENNKDVFVGRFHSVEDAYNAYLCAKNNRLKDLLNKYKEYMPNNVCDAIENYINTNKIKAACEAA